MKAEYTDDWIFLSGLTPKEKHIATNILDAGTLKKGYRLPRNIWAMREIYKAFPAIQTDSVFVAVGAKLKQDQEGLLDFRLNEISNGILRMRYPKLRPYQLADMYYLSHLPAAGVFNEPRTGKTPTVISVIKELGTKRNLVICPASLIWNWANEFEQWYPDAEVMVCDARKMKDPPTHFALESGYRIVIVSKDMLKTRLSLFDDFRWDTCVVDEAHFLRNWKSVQSSAIYQIKADRRYVLSGTPTVKHASDIFGILHFLYPKKYPSYWQFVGRYFELGKDWMGHNVVGNPRPERVKELQEMIALMSTQRKRKEVMQWLPEKQRSTFAVMMDTKQQKLYTDMLKFFTASEETSGREVDTQNVISQLMRLRQLCLDPRLLGFDVTGAKTTALLEYLENHQEPIIIMSMFTSYLKLIKPEVEKLGLKVGFIHGEMSNKAKDTTASDFQAGRTDVLLCNIISAGVGFTLDNSSTVVFMDKAWNPTENEQAEDRICPTSEERNHKHEIITFTCMKSVDARIDEVLAQKKSLTDYINEGGKEALKNLMRG